MCTVQQSIMIELLKSLLAKELITQDTYDKATEAVLNNTEWPNIFDTQDNTRKCQSAARNPLQRIVI